MRLWSIHAPGFSLTAGKVEHSKSEYYYDDNSKLRESYHKLWERIQIPDGQIIWCYTQKDGIPKTGVEMRLWKLEVPNDDIIRFVDDLVWNRTFDNECGVGTQMRRQWRIEAIALFPNQLVAREEYQEQCRKDFWAQKSKSGDWWDELFVEEPGECISAIIRHPVPIEWVDSTEPYFYT